MLKSLHKSQQNGNNLELLVIWLTSNQRSKVKYPIMPYQSP